MRPSKALNRLVRACLSDARTLRSESGYVDDYRRSVLSRLALERTQFGEELRGLGATARVRGGTAPFWLEIWRRLWRGLRVLAAGPNDGDAISECRRSRDRAEAVYERAIALPLSEHILPVLRAQHGRIQRDREALIALQF